MKKKILLITGIRPNIVKAFSLYRELLKEKQFENILLHTNQHFDDEMFNLFWREFNLPSPILLNLKYSNNADRFGKIVSALSKKFLDLNPDLVIVFGDGDSTLAAAITAKKLNFKLAHVEAGLRSFDDNMPEEINRIAVDHMSDLLFLSEYDARFNLITEEINQERMFFVGNTMIDTLIYLKNKIDKTIIKSLTEKEYILLTLHRQSNVDNKEELLKIFDFVGALPHKVLFPIHPRTKKNLKFMSLFNKIPNNVELLSPLGYLDFLSLEKGALAVLTDSGGVQEETTFLDIPCLTLRKNTERPITLSEGTNNLILDDLEDCDKKEAYLELFEQSIKKRSNIPNLWDGAASQRIVEILKNILL